MCLDGRHDLVREIIVGLTEYLQTFVTQVHTLTMLLADFLPQPMAETDGLSHARRLGHNCARDISEELHEEVFQERNFDVGEVVRVIAGVNPMLTELMAFMEDAQWEFSESEDAHGSLTILRAQTSTASTGPSSLAPTSPTAWNGYVHRTQNV